jgi:hypothetical protein
MPGVAERGFEIFRDIFDRAHLTAVAPERSCLGESAFPFRATLFDKSPQQNWLVVWHQDTALPLCGHRDVAAWGPWSIKEGIVCAHAPAHALEQVLAIRVHLDDSNEENGPLRVLPGTHRRGVLRRHTRHLESSDVIQLLCPCWRRCGHETVAGACFIQGSSKCQPTAGSPHRICGNGRFPGWSTLRIC